MQKIQPLINGEYYHIYNRGINRENLFITNDNYNHFLNLYEKYIHPIADTFAWCLMPNHFHLLIRIKEEAEIDTLQLPIPKAFTTCNTGFSLKIKSPHLYFSDLFNAYTQGFNKYSCRTNSLFSRPFKRILVDTEIYLKQLIIYIHRNPVKHGFTKKCSDYTWSSYNAILSGNQTEVECKKVIEWFGDKTNFIKTHAKSEFELPEHMAFEL